MDLGGGAEEGVCIHADLSPPEGSTTTTVAALDFELQAHHVALPPHRGRQRRLDRRQLTEEAISPCSRSSRHDRHPPSVRVGDGRFHETTAVDLGWVLGHQTQPSTSVSATSTPCTKLGQGQFVCTKLSTGMDYNCKSISKHKLISKVYIEDAHRHGALRRRALRSNRTAGTLHLGFRMRQISTSPTTWASICPCRHRLVWWWRVVAVSSRSSFGGRRRPTRFGEDEHVSSSADMYGSSIISDLRTDKCR
uniref:Uncharacterized protein n=1 Tax=Leersia perrieri TaxID=77586 RepID=A0A0D9VLT5_9ORYZ